MSDKRAAPAPGDRTVIGIAFGNSNSSIAYTVDDKAEVIANEDGDRQIPTILSYVEGEEYYGQQAKNFLIRSPKNTVAYFRDFLGKEYGKPTCQSQTLAPVPDAHHSSQVQVDRPHAQPRLGPPPRDRRRRYIYSQGQGGRGR